MRYGIEDEDEQWKAFVVREDGAAESQSVWKLNIYRLAHDSGVAAHRLSLQLPKHELYEPGNQLRRAAESVSANLVEGDGRRRYKAEDLRFLIFAKASSSESEEHLHHVQDRHPEHQSEAVPLLEAANTSGRKRHRFMQLVEARHCV